MAAENSYFYIQSKLSQNLVMDVCHYHTNPGAEIISFLKKAPKTGNPTDQLWTKRYVNDKWFYVVSKMDDKKIAIEDGKAVISTSGVGTLFQETVVLTAYDPSNANSNQVLTIDGASTSPDGVPIVAPELNTSGDTSSQEWSYSPGPSNYY